MPRNLFFIIPKPAGIRHGDPGETLTGGGPSTPGGRWFSGAGPPEPLHSQPDPIGVGTWGVDYWQADNFIVYRPETADDLYKEYTPVRVD